MHRQHSRGPARASTTARPAQDELPSTLADVEESVSRLKKHVHDTSLPQSIRRKIQTVHAAVQSLRANVDAEFVLPTTSSPLERSEFNCVEVAMEKLKKRIRADSRKRIVMDSDATESEPERVVGPSMPNYLIVKKEDPSVKDEGRLVDDGALVVKKKRRRIIRMSPSSDEGDKPPPPKVKAPPPQPRRMRDDASDTDTDGDNVAQPQSLPTASRQPAVPPSTQPMKAQNSTLTSPKVEPPSPPSLDDDDVDMYGDEPAATSGATTPIQTPRSPPTPKRAVHDPSTYSGDSSDNDTASSVFGRPSSSSTANPTRSRAIHVKKSPPKVSALPSDARAKAPSSGMKSPLSITDASTLRTQRVQVLSGIHASNNGVDGSSLSDDDGEAVQVDRPHDSPVRGAKTASPPPFPRHSTSPPPKALPRSILDPMEPASPTPAPRHPPTAPSPLVPLPPPINSPAIIDISKDSADEHPTGQPTATLDRVLDAAIDVSSSDSSDSSAGKSPPKKRVSVWHTTPVGQTTAAASSSDDSSSSSDDESTPSRPPTGSTTRATTTAASSLTSPHRGPLWPNLDKFIGMLVSPSRPRLLPDHFVFPKTYTSVAHYMSGLQQAIVEESLTAFDNKSNKQAALTTAPIAAVSPYNASLQSVLFRLPKPKSAKAKGPSAATPTLLQSHDVVLLCPKSSRGNNCKTNGSFPGIAMSTSLTQDDIVVLVSTAYTIDTLQSYDIHLVGNLTTGSREYQAALSLPSWPASLQAILTTAVIPTSASLGVVPVSLIPTLRKQFNDHQFQAIQMAIHQPMTLIQGPPGTGKTHTILGIIQALLHQPSSRRAKISVGAALGVNTQPDIRLLVTAPSNAAVNVILHKIQAQHPDLAMVRLGQPTSPSLVWLENLIELDKSKKLVGSDWSSQEARERLLDGAQIVFCTLSGAGSWSMWNPKRSHFDAVIVDEAAQATEASSLIPLRFCAQRYVWVGDHKQLPATILSTRLARMDYDQSFFQRVVSNPLNHVVMLREQYRMHPDIAALPSRMFYSNDLVNVHRHPPDTAYHAAGFPPYMFYDVMDGAQSRVETSYRNMPEVAFIATRLKELLKVPYDFKNKIGIISPYKSQIEAIKDALHAAKLTKAKIEVNTVDGFQGREKEIIIVSCVRTLRSGDNSFWGDVRRMNVSLTRAISSCWVIGNSNLLRESPAWAELLDDCKRRGVYQKVAAQVPIKAAPTSPAHAAGRSSAGKM